MANLGSTPLLMRSRANSKNDSFSSSSIFFPPDSFNGIDDEELLAHLAVVSPVLDLGGRLAVDACAATEGGHGIATGAAL